MVYKKYIRKNGKIYGPYLYHSKRIDGKVVNTYHGPKKKISRKKVGKLLLGLLFLFSVSFFLFFGTDFVSNFISGQAVLGLDSEFIEGQPLKGTLKISLKEGELLPSSSRVVFKNSRNSYEFELSELITEKVTQGNFYVENTAIEGSGFGYGIEGSKQIYPRVYFELDVFSGPKPRKQQEKFTENETKTVEINETIEDVVNRTKINETVESVNDTEIKTNITVNGTITNQTEEEVTIINESTTETKETSNITVDETVPIETKEKKDEKKEEKNKTKNPLDDVSVSKGSESDSVAESGQNFSDVGITGGVIRSMLGVVSNVFLTITGQATLNYEDTVTGNATFNEPFTIVLEKEQTAKVKPGSVVTDLKKISDKSVRVDVENNIAIAKSLYSEIEKGFGEDYLGKKTKVYEISLDSLNLTFEKGELSVKIDSGDVEIISLNTILEEGVIKAETINITTNETRITSNITTNLTTNFAIKQIKDIPDITISKNRNATLNLSEYFISPPGVNYTAVENENINISIFSESLL
ncbi:MAG: hypothetical protein ACE5ES_04340, partial [Candidatus Nanoarchaeia archaeon]